MGGGGVGETLRPDLRADLRHDCEADFGRAEAHPRERAEGREGRGELCGDDLVSDGGAERIG